MAKWSLAAVQEFLSEKYPGKYTLLAWSGTGRRCDIRCNCGKQWRPFGMQLTSKGQGCPECGKLLSANKQRTTIEQAQGRLDTQGKGLTITSHTWIDTQHPCTINCANGHSWVTKGTKVLNEGSGCRVCFEESMRQWTEEMLLSEAELYSSRSGFQQKSPNAYNVMYKRFPHLLDKVFEIRSQLYNTRETLYLWEVVGSNPRVYKVGVTSKSRGLRRIEEVAQAANVKFNIILYRELPSLAKAAKAEKELSAIGSPVDIGRFNGSTEFRLFTDDQIADALLKYGSTSSLDD